MSDNLLLRRFLRQCAASALAVMLTLLLHGAARADEPPRTGHSSFIL